MCANKMDLKHGNFNSGTLHATLVHMQHATVNHRGKAWCLTCLDGEDTSQHFVAKGNPI